MRTSWLMGLAAAALVALVLSVATMMSGSFDETASVASQERDR